jgi:putative sigma-54 modulation protein
MQMTITGKNMEITPAIKQYAEDKLAKMHKYLESISDAHVVLSLQKYSHIAEITLHVNGITIRGEERSDDMYSSLDLVMDKVERQLRKYKEKIVAHGLRKGNRTAAMKPIVPLPDEANEEGGKILRTKRFAIKPQYPDEAIMQMELLGHSFFVFRNADTEEINVIYKRKDGNYGLIEPSSSEA